MTQTLHVPENWPCVWWAEDNSRVRLSCPGCGAFALLLTLSKPDNAIRSLQCEACDLGGFEPVQAAMLSWQTRQRADDEVHKEAAQEGDLMTAIKRNGRKVA